MSGVWQQRHGFADRVAAANHHRVLAFEIDPGGLDQLHATIGCTGQKTGQASHQIAGALHRVAVHILGGGNGLDHALRVDVFGQRHLHQDAVDAGVEVERLNAGQQIRLAQRGIVFLENRVDTGLGAGLDLVAHIHGRRRIVADQDHRQAGSHALGFERCGAGGDVGAELAGEGNAVDQLGGHGGLGGAWRGVETETPTEQVGRRCGEGLDGADSAFGCGWTERNLEQVGHGVGREFFHDVGAVRLHRLDADAQVVGDLFVEAACDDPLQHLRFA